MKIWKILQNVRALIVRQTSGEPIVMVMPVVELGRVSVCQREHHQIQQRHVEDMKK